MFSSPTRHERDAITPPSPSSAIDATAVETSATVLPHAPVKAARTAGGRQAPLGRPTDHRQAEIGTFQSNTTRRSSRCGCPKKAAIDAAAKANATELPRAPAKLFMMPFTPITKRSGKRSKESPCDHQHLTHQEHNQCGFCGGEFPSRSILFRHLRLSCDPPVPPGMMPLDNCTGSSSKTLRCTNKYNIEALCAAPPEALAHSPSQMPLGCPVAPPISASRELHKDCGSGGGGGVALRARAARAPKASSCATSCVTSSATSCAASCAASFAYPRMYVRMPLHILRSRTFGRRPRTPG